MKIYVLLGLVLCGVTLLNAATDKVVCYFGSWSVYHPGNGEFSVEDINPKLCTHVIYAFAGLDNSTNTVKILDPWNDITLRAYTRFVNLNQSNANVKRMLAVGGWNEGSSSYSNMTSSPETRKTFIESVVKLLKTYGFDGFDLDWEYPTLGDRANFVSLLAETKSRFTNESLLLSIAVAATKDYQLTSYNVPEINKNVDFVNVMTYDLHGSWESRTGHNAPLYGATWETDATTSMYNVDACVRGWLESGLAASKLVMGIPIYGRTFTLASSLNTGVGSPTLGAGSPGPYTNAAGTLTYLEVCERLKNDSYTRMWDNVQQVPYAFKGNQWISYDNVTSVILKVNYAKSQNLGGVMLWSIDSDDVKNKCGDGVNPIMSAVYSTLFGSPGSTTTTAKATTITTTTPKSTTTTAKPSTTTTKVTTTTTPKYTSTTAKVTTTTPRTTTTTTTAKTTTTTKPTATTERPITTTPSVGAMMCPPSGYKRDPNDCRSFYQCVPGLPVIFSWRITCQSGLYFDEISNACNWPYFVKC